MVVRYSSMLRGTTDGLQRERSSSLSISSYKNLIFFTLKVKW